MLSLGRTLLPPPPSSHFLTYVDKEEKEVLDVKHPNTVVSPGTVMIHAAHTSTTLPIQYTKKTGH